MATDLLLAAAFLAAGVVAAWWTIRLWNRWRATKRSPMLAGVSPRDYGRVSTSLSTDRLRAPRSDRWPDFAETVSYSEARAYERIARSRSETHLIAGEFLVTFGGALLGSVAFDVTSEGPNSAIGKQVALLVAVVLTVVGLFLARVLNRLWVSHAKGYGAAATKKARKSAKVRRTSGRRRVTVAGSAAAARARPMPRAR